MSHIFTFQDLAHYKVSLEFASDLFDQASTSSSNSSTITWQPRLQNISVPASSQCLSVRVNESFVNGRLCVSLSLVYDPESEAEIFGRHSSQKSLDTLAAKGDLPPTESFTKLPEDDGVLYVDPSETDSILALPGALVTDSGNSFIHSKLPSSQSDLVSGFPSPNSQAETWHSELGHQRIRPLNAMNDCFHEINSDLEYLNNASEFLFSPTILPLDILPNDAMVDSIFTSDAKLSFSTEITPNSSSNLSLLSLDPSLSLSIEECRSDRTPWSDSSSSSSPEFTTTTSSTTTTTPTNLSEDSDHDYCYTSSSSSGDSDDRDIRRDLEGCTRTARSSPRDTVNLIPSVTATPTMGITMARLRKKKRFPCSLCEETFSRRHDMMRHEWKVVEDKGGTRFVHILRMEDRYEAEFMGELKPLRRP
ncbi:hypothetical protein K435DRAFT_968280 [Dendrothele bispora CBS 962.96]|uniref:Uncharacterized protein n=1 Tax=Dendrothele bispora (strain CBS 962.96) TaxID=1314807 RepID=A0A4V4HEI7_DENBC|nr:hypothetical protein K435DRAFT_968280 [Dendrothele bispora CBS 962.96]